MQNNNFVNVDVYSKFHNSSMKFQAFVDTEKNETVITHNSLKAYMLEFMKNCASKGTPVTVQYTPIETSLTHSIVSCTVSLSGYSITETGEANVATLNTTVAKSYPYLTAEIRAFDRAVISFLQLNTDGKRPYSDQEMLY